MGIDKLKSGSYRYRFYYKGKTYSKVFDHEPLVKEIKEAEKEFLAGKEDVPSMSFDRAYETFIRERTPVLSPTTIRGYKQSYSRLPARFTVKKLSAIDSKFIQSEIVNEMIGKEYRQGKTYSTKTIKNTADLVRDVMNYFIPDFKYSVVLPQKDAKDIYVPTDEEVAIIMADAKDTMFEIPLKLACHGMRLGEICALDVCDVDRDGTIHITKSRARNSDKEWIIKLPKNDNSRRDITVNKELADKIINQGYVYRGHQNSITKYLSEVEKKHNITHFSVHALRHYFCSKCIDMGIDFLTIQKLGGWKSTHTLMRVYAHVMKEKEKREKIANELAKMF